MSNISLIVCPLVCYRYCSVHFKRNLARVANVSKAIPPTSKNEFKELCLNLLDIESFHDFHDQVLKISRKFPDASSWLAWYLDPDRARILFPSCKNLLNLSAQEHHTFEKMKKDTNAQEGLLEVTFRVWQVQARKDCIKG